MEKYLDEPVRMKIENLYPDPNNPRLARDERPGYHDISALINPETQEFIFGCLAEKDHGIELLVETIIGQGWTPIDQIVVYLDPADDTRAIVVEGNRRRLALERIRLKVLPKAEKKLAKLRNQRIKPEDAIPKQEELVKHLALIVEDTNELFVTPMAAKTAEELERKLPGVLAVRHIQGAKNWGPYAENQWLLERYFRLFTDKHGEDKRHSWDDELTKRVADEASVSHAMVKRHLKSASWYANFRSNWEDKMPDGEALDDSDYYLFQEIASRPWIRTQLEIGNDDFALSQESEAVLFEWSFSEPRPTGQPNPNIFYKHENIRLWDAMHRYDEKEGTAFASRFDVQQPELAKPMYVIEPEYLSHKARRAPHEVIDPLLQEFCKITAEQLASEGQNLQAQLRELHEQSGRFIRMMEAAD